MEAAGIEPAKISAEPLGAGIDQVIEAPKIRAISIR